MDIRYNFQRLLLITLLCIQNGLSIIPDEDYFDEPAQFNRCPWIRNKLKNGRVRYRYKGRVAKFLCDSGFELAGKRSATCVRGQWSNPIPVCVARGCMRVPQLSNGRITEMYKGALLAFDCNPGYVLDGNPTIHCDGRRWSASPPFCVIATENPDTNCDFENPDLCGWTHDPNHDFDWTRNQFSTPSGHVGTGPEFDHTFGENKGGFYLYIEASSPRKINDTARIFSPVYHKDLSGGCFKFWYHMYGATTGGLRVYLKPESHVFDELKPNWEKYGNQGNQWLKGHMIVPVLNENFQIVIEGLRGESYVGDSAIDDVRLTPSLCDSDDNSTDITEAVDQDSCRGRCQESGTESSCGCNPSCVDEPNFCCRDYYTICSAGNHTTVQNSEEPLPDDYKTTSASASKSPISSTISNNEETSTFTKEPLTEKTELTNETSSVSSTMLTAAFISPTTHIFTTLLSTNSVTPSVINVSSTKYISSTESSTSSEASSSTVLSTELSASPATNSESTSLATTTTSTTVNKTTSTTLKTTSTTLKTTSTSLKTTSTSLKTTSTTPNYAPTTTLTSLPTVKQAITTTTNQTTSQPTSTITSPLSSTLKLATQKVNNPLDTSSSTTIKSTSTYSTGINTTSSTAAMSSNTESIISSTTTLSITRKIYNLRPRNRTSPIPVYTTLPTVSTKTAATLNSYVPLQQDTSTSSLTTSSNYLTSWERYSASPYTKQQRTSTFLQSSTKSFLPETSSIASYVSYTTIPSISKTMKFANENTKPTKSPKSKTSNTFEASKTETSSSNSSIPVIISVVIVILICLTAGVAYYMKKQRNKRQSKLSDDSEMRFLQENDYMEYSDASVLDKILVK